MSAECTNTSAARPDVKELQAELEVPFSPDQVQWRVTNTITDKKTRTGRALRRSASVYRSTECFVFPPRMDTRLQSLDHEQHHPHEEGREHPLGQNIRYLHGHHLRPVVALRDGRRMG